MLVLRGCSVTRGLGVEAGDIEDYRRLERFHYRERRLGPYAAIFALRGKGTGVKTVGVIVYTMPSARLELRKVATGNIFAGFDKRTVLGLINKNIRCIGRVIIEPRFRGLGLASRLVRETMGRMDVPIIEAMAVMGAVNPFLERAGMKAYRGKRPVRVSRLLEALSLVGIEEEELIDAEVVEGKLGALGGDDSGFIEEEMRKFLDSYGVRRYMRAGLERTRFVLSKLTSRPAYYIWMNENSELRV